MNENKKEEISNFLQQLMQSEEGRSIMSDSLKPKEETPKVVEQPQVLVKPEPQPEPVQEVRVQSEVQPIQQYQQPEESRRQDRKSKKGNEKDTWWSKSFNKKRLNKASKVAIVYLRNNGNVDLLEQETRNGFFNINGKSYHEDTDCTYTLTKDRFPLCVIREWDTLPLGTKKWDDEDIREKFAKLETHVLNGIRHAELVKSGGIKEGPNISMKQMIIWGIAAIVVGAVIINYI